VNKTTLLSKPETIRSGYPLSSERINYVLDAFLYDLCTILETPLPKLEEDIDSYITTLEYFEREIAMNSTNTSGTDFDNDHTKDWRLV